MKYDINKKSYENANPIGRYIFFGCWAYQSYIDVLDIKSGYDNIII